MSGVLTGRSRGGASVYDDVMYGSDGRTVFDKGVFSENLFVPQSHLP